MAQAREYSAVNLHLCRWVGGRSGLSGRFAACPPACGLLLYLRKTSRQPTPKRACVVPFESRTAGALVAMGVVCLPQRSKGGARRAGDMSGGGYAASVADSAHGALCEVKSHA